MKTRWKSSLLLLFLCCGVGCDDAPAPQPLSAQQKYEKAQALLKPNVENAASDVRGALQLLREAAQAGYLPAMLDYAGIFLEGSKDGSVTKNRVEAMQWYRRAAAAGSMEAEYYIGFILYGDRKVEAAMPYFQRAADAGIPEAQFLYGRILLQKNDARGVDYVRRAAESDRAATVAQAAYTMGVVCQEGRGGQKVDLPQAVEWFKRSADAGDPRALHLVGLMYLNGKGVEQDEQKGATMLRLAAGQDYPAAIKDYITYLQSLDDPTPYADEIRAWATRLQELQKNAKP